MPIDVRMFDVGLGSAILLEFGKDRRRVRVLVDGGDARAGIGVEAALAGLSYDGSDRRPLLDLVVGTHYDADHLDGLTEILRRNRVRVNEVWLPPVLDDADPRETGRVPRPSRTLARLFAGDGGEAAFRRYVAAKRARLSALDRIEGLSEGDLEDPRSEDAELGRERSHFEQAASRAAEVLGDRGCEHDPDADLLAGSADGRLSPWLDELSFRLSFERDPSLIAEEARRWPGYDPGPIRTTLAMMRLATAKDGINACALRALLVAIAARPEIRTRQLWCDDDAALELGWSTREGRFVVGGTDGPTIKLLGPTERLVAERRDKLPRATLAFAAGRWDRLQGLTHSNQLSYVLRFDFDGEALLLTGDSGFDGFAVGRDRANRYEPALVRHLKGLAVVQVPHHGGINRHFYRALEDAAFSAEQDEVYLLLSHEAGSAHRPNGAFASFMRRTMQRRRSLLFTGAPAEENVADYVERILPVQPPGEGPGGEVRLSFDDVWRVVRHGDNRPRRPSGM